MNDKGLAEFLVAVLVCVSLIVNARGAEDEPQQVDKQAAVLSLVESAEKKIVDLHGKLRECRNVAIDIALPDASLAVAELFVRFSRSDARIPERRATALRSMEYVVGLLDRTLQEADDVLAGTIQFEKTPQWNVIGLQVRDGGFWSGGDPVFLSGINWDAEMAEHEPEMLRRLGINLVDGMLRGGLTASGAVDDGWYTARSKNYLNQMQRNNFAVDCMLSTRPPKWLHRRHPDLESHGYGHYTHFAIDHPAYMEYRLKTLDKLLPLYAQHKAVLAIDLMNEPAYQGASKYTFSNWRSWLKKKYGSLQNVNEAWGTEFADFDAIDSFPAQPKVRKHEWQRADIDWKKPGARGMHYDWCVFNKHRVTAYFRSADDRIRHHMPHVSTHVKTMLGNYFTGGTEQRGWPMKLSYNTFGIDLEATNQGCGLSGGDDSFRDLSAVENPNRYFGSSPYIAAWLNSGLATDLLKSISPDKPFYNSEFHGVEEVDSEENDPIPAEHMQLAMWHSHLHGMRANLLWYWGRGADGAASKQGRGWFDDSLLEQPWLLNAYARESLNLRRFVPQVSAFARQARPVRLLYCEASAIQDVSAIDTLRDAYEALNFLGVHVGFVTERQLASDWLSGSEGQQTRLIIVPNASYVPEKTISGLRVAAQSGISVCIIGDRSLLLNPTGQPHVLTDIPNAKKIDLAATLEYHLQIDHWIANAGIDRQLVARDEQGLPAWGIEVRTANAGNQRLAYLVNLMREPRTVRLDWAFDDVQFRDLRTNEDLPGTITLQPRQIVFGEY